MSDILAAAAAALGTPEALVQRSAAARAAETGASVDDILTAWAGGAPPPTASPDATAAETDETSPAAAPAETEPAASAIVETPASPAPVVEAAAGPYKPPVLVEARDNPAKIMLGAIGLFLVILLVGLVGPSIPIDEAGARTSDLAFSGDALDGQLLYESQGCSACHTQMVRPVVADVGLGNVTLNDSNQLIGTRRFGPDLSDVGSRLDASQIEEIVSGDNDTHPAYRLNSDDMAAVVAYLSESRTSG
jgi:hypothetical protein